MGNMVKNNLKEINIFWRILGLLSVFFLIFCLFTNGGKSYILSGVGDGEAQFSSWLDENANGVRDSNEPPLAGVCVWAGYNIINDFQENRDLCQFTDKDGKWEEFLPGGSCEEFYVFVQAPDGYQATTNLAANSCSTEFGFVESTVKVSHKVLTIQEFIHKMRLIQWIKRIGIGILIAILVILGINWLLKKS
jgi:hypothetical protein